MGLVLVRNAENDVLHGPLRKQSRAAGCLPLVCVKTIYSVHSQTTKKCAQNDPVLTLQFYNYPNTAIYWPISATSFGLGRAWNQTSVHLPVVWALVSGV